MKSKRAGCEVRAGERDHFNVCNDRVRKHRVISRGRTFEPKLKIKEWGQKTNVSLVSSSSAVRQCPVFTGVDEGGRWVCVGLGWSKRGRGVCVNSRSSRRLLFVHVDQRKHSPACCACEHKRCLWGVSAASTEAAVPALFMLKCKDKECSSSWGETNITSSGAQIWFGQHKRGLQGAPRNRCLAFLWWISISCYW